MAPTILIPFPHIPLLAIRHDKIGTRRTIHNLIYRKNVRVLQLLHVTRFGSKKAMHSDWVSVLRWLEHFDRHGVGQDAILLVIFRRFNLDWSQQCHQSIHARDSPRRDRPISFQH